MNTTFYPHEDGVTHINIYSNGNTELGRFLSNFAYAPMVTEDGRFLSVEGYWHWLSTNDDALRKLSGFQAKEYARSLGVKRLVDSEKFRGKIKRAIHAKIYGNRSMLVKFAYSTLPFTHYYVYEKRVVGVPESEWVMEYLTSLRTETRTYLEELRNEIWHEAGN